MTGSEYPHAAEQVIRLCACAVKGSAPDPQWVAELDLERLYGAARFHQLTAAVGMALEAAGCADERFQKAVAMAQRKIILLDRDRAALLAELESAGIWYMPLKGVILKELYPRLGMREMADNDILFDAERARDVREIMKRLGFTVDSFGIDHHDVYSKPPVSHFEMHRKLIHFVPNVHLTAYYKDVKDRLLKDRDNDFGYHFSDEDFYLFLVAHEYKHYNENGTGLRSLLDIYVFLRRRQPDMEYVAREAEKMGIADFERKNRELALRLFDGQPLDAGQTEMLERIASDGTYGSVLRGIDRQLAEKGRLRYFFSRLTIPYEKMLEIFPILNKAPFLYPFFWFYRLLRGLFFRRKKTALQIRAILGGEKSRRR